LMKPPLGGLASIISRDLKYQYDSWHHLDLGLAVQMS
jgi:hypothetical protein